MDTGNLAIVTVFTVAFLSTFVISFFIYKILKEKYGMIKHAIDNNYPNAHLLLLNGHGEKRAAYVSGIKKIAAAVALIVPCFFDIDRDIKIILLSAGSFLLIYGAGPMWWHSCEKDSGTDNAETTDTDEKAAKDKQAGKITTNVTDEKENKI